MRRRPVHPAVHRRKNTCQEKSSSAHRIALFHRTRSVGFGQEPDVEADDPAEDIDFDEILERIHKETGLCEKVILAVLKAQAGYLDDLWGDEEETGEEENA